MAPFVPSSFQPRNPQTKSLAGGTGSSQGGGVKRGKEKAFGWTAQSLKGFPCFPCLQYSQCCSCCWYYYYYYSNKSKEAFSQDGRPTSHTVCRSAPPYQVYARHKLAPCHLGQPSCAAVVQPPDQPPLRQWDGLTNKLDSCLMAEQMSPLRGESSITGCMPGRSALPPPINDAPSKRVPDVGVGPDTSLKPNREHMLRPVLLMYAECQKVKNKDIYI